MQTRDNNLFCVGRFPFLSISKWRFTHILLFLNRTHLIIAKSHMAMVIRLSMSVHAYTNMDNGFRRHYLSTQDTPCHQHFCWHRVQYCMKKQRDGKLWDGIQKSHSKIEWVAVISYPIYSCCICSLLLCTRTLYHKNLYLNKSNVAFSRNIKFYKNIKL